MLIGVHRLDTPEKMANCLFGSWEGINLDLMQVRWLSFSQRKCAKYHISAMPNLMKYIVHYKNVLCTYEAGRPEIGMDGRDTGCNMYNDHYFFFCQASDRTQKVQLRMLDVITMRLEKQTKVVIGNRGSRLHISMSKHETQQQKYEMWISFTGFQTKNMFPPEKWMTNDRIHCIMYSHLILTTKNPRHMIYYQLVLPVGCWRFHFNPPIGNSFSSTALWPRVYTVNQSLMCPYCSLFGLIHFLLRINHPSMVFHTINFIVLVQFKAGFCVQICPRGIKSSLKIIRDPKACYFFLAFDCWRFTRFPHCQTLR